jgi:RNA polymerase subunit RPABC4/transcription elongation factor Spt4
MTTFTVPPPPSVPEPPKVEPPAYQPPGVEMPVEADEIPEMEEPMEVETVAEESDGGFALEFTEPEPEPEPELAQEMAPPTVTSDEGHTACSICGFPMETEWKVCPNCVTRYETSCGGCGRVLQPWWLVCPWCETPKSQQDIHFGG